jgi:putative transposase
MDIGDRARSLCFLSGDRDAKFTSAFDQIFTGEGLRMVKFPPKSSSMESQAAPYLIGLIP